MRDRAPSFARVWETWTSTVRRDRNSRAAMSGLGRPSATRRADQRPGAVQRQPPHRRDRHAAIGEGLQLGQRFVPPPDPVVIVARGAPAGGQPMRKGTPLGRAEQLADGDIGLSQPVERLQYDHPVVQTERLRCPTGSRQLRDRQGPDTGAAQLGGLGGR